MDKPFNEKDELYSLFSDMYKERHNIRPHWINYNEVTEEDLQSMIEDLQNRPIKNEEPWFDDFEDQPSGEVPPEEQPFPPEDTELSEPSWDDEPEAQLPSRSGMGRALTEALMTVLREAILESKPSAGLTKKEKSETVKDAKSGKDMGKPGKNFAKVAKKAGGGEKGKKVAGAAFWKNLKKNKGK